MELEPGAKLASVGNSLVAAKSEGGLDDLLGEEGLKLSFPELGRKRVTKKKAAVLRRFEAVRRGFRAVWHVGRLKNGGSWPVLVWFLSL